METCKVCGQRVDMPFVCSYCGGRYCAYHRLPETHSCPNLVLARPPTRLEWAPKRETRTHAFSMPSSRELWQILVALVVLAFSFSYRYFYPLASYPEAFAISIVTVGSGFILHELAHRFAAQYYGYWAEFRLWTYGLLLALALALISGGRFVFAAPGAVYIVPTWTAAIDYHEIKRRSGLVSVIGPLVNLGLAALFYGLYLTGQTAQIAALITVGLRGMWVNTALAAFNMLPLGILDGKKVFDWNPVIWATITIPAWIVVLFY